MRKKFIRTLTLELRPSDGDQRALDTRVPGDYAIKPGLAGTFLPLDNDFSLIRTTKSRESENKSENGYQMDETRAKRAKRVRFFICSLAICGHTLSLMSRLLLNVSIVEMVRRPPEPLDQSQQEPQEPLGATGHDFGSGGQLHFDWSKREVNMILGAFYIGYAPGILVSSGLAQRYGAKWPMFVCVLGTALINLFTPEIAQTSINLLIGSRIILGLIQGSVVPCLYELFNRWLTQTESSMFIPLTRLPFGAILGTSLPGLLAWFDLAWPLLFHIGGYLCLGWALIWVFLATSRPQDNNLVQASELQRIMRKKAAHLQHHQAAATNRSSSQTRQAARKSTPWLLIVTNPSVLSLVAVKFTGYLAMDFIFLQIAVYLRQVHGAPIETISAIASGNFFMQLLLTALVGWLAKVVVLKRALGLSVTKWRKIFSAGSNLCMAATYLVLANVQTFNHLPLTSGLFLLVCFFSMFSVGGESMVPYDLTSEYPASIVGFTHAVSMFSSITFTAACDLILGEHTEDPARWALLFYLLAGALTLGALIFALLLKAKPFLPGERPAIDARQQEPAPVISSISHDLEMTQTNRTTISGFR